MSHGLEAAADVLGMAGLMGLASLYFWLIGRLGSGSRNKIGLGGAPNEATLQKVRAFLDGLAAKLGEGQSYVDTNSKNVEWRGQVHDHPVRIQVYWQYTIQLYVKGPAGLGDLPTLRWDEKLVPQVGAPPPWDTTDTELVFLAKGVYVEGSSAETTRDLARFRRLPQEVGQALVTDMREVGIERVYFDDDGFVEADFKTDLYELPDPGPKIVRMVQTLVRVVGAVQAGLPPAAVVATGHSGPASPGEKITCPYCGSVYLLTPVTPGHPAYGCPNCGAPPQEAA